MLNPEDIKQNIRVILQNTFGNIECSCEIDWKGRGRVDPNCLWCNYGKYLLEDFEALFNAHLKPKENYLRLSNGEEYPYKGTFPVTKDSVVILPGQSCYSLEKQDGSFQPNDNVVSRRPVGLNGKGEHIALFEWSNRIIPSYRLVSECYSTREKAINHDDNK